jgi:hypothetical protein
MNVVPTHSFRGRYSWSAGGFCPHSAARAPLGCERPQSLTSLSALFMVAALLPCIGISIGSAHSSQLDAWYMPMCYYT